MENHEKIVEKMVKEFSTELMERARTVQGNQYPDNSEEYKAYQSGFENALAMVYIDLTGTPKTKGMLRTALIEAHQAGIDEAVEKIIVHIQRKGYDRQFAEDFIRYDTIEALQDNK